MKRALAVYLIAFLAGCGGGSESTPTVVSPSPSPTVSAPLKLQNSSYKNSKEMGFEQIKVTMSPGVPGTLWNSDILGPTYARADFAQNGKPGILLTTQFYTDLDSMEQAKQKPALLSFWRLKTDGYYEKDPTIKIDNPWLTTCIHPRKLFVADFNGDNLPDVAIACHGYDYPPFPGEQIQVVLSRGVGDYYVTSFGENQFWHSGSAADMNGDGYIDILATDRSSVRIFLNDGHANFTEAINTGLIKPPLQGGGVQTVEVIDINQDGHPDILAGGAETASPTVIYYGNGTVDFNNPPVHVLPKNLEVYNVIDFLYLPPLHQGEGMQLYLNRTTYDNEVIEKIDLSTMKATVVYRKNSGRWLYWLTAIGDKVMSETSEFAASVQR